MAGIYMLESPSGKVYIGQSWEVKAREYVYKGLHCKSQIKLYNSLKKYGWDAHKFEIIHVLPEDITQEILDNYEVFYWQQYKDCGFEMMNTKEPGSHGKHSEETKEKISKAKKEQLADGEYRKKISIGLIKYFKKNPQHNQRKVYQYSLEGKFIREWQGICIAAKKLGIYQSNISLCAIGKYKKSGGFIWKYNKI